jgi:hypothetical protein
MIKSILSIAFALAAVLSFNPAQAGEEKWKEMNDFHAIMAKTFHPAEEGNLQPVKENAEALLASARTWQKSTAPEGYKKDEATEILSRLVRKCDELSAAVKSKASDEDLTRLITEAHDIFHEIAEKCMPGDHGHGHDHSHGHDGHKH